MDARGVFVMHKHKNIGGFPAVFVQMVDILNVL